MDLGAGFRCHRESEAGRMLRPVLMSQADRLDRLPVTRPLPDRSRPDPDAVVDDRLDDAVTIVVLTQVERTLAA